MPQGQTNSVKGPNSKQQKLTNESVINRNESIQIEMNTLHVELLDIYDKMRPIQSMTQRPRDIHVFPKGEMIMLNHICNPPKQSFFHTTA